MKKKSESPDLRLSPITERPSSIRKTPSPTKKGKRAREITGKARRPTPIAVERALVLLPAELFGEGVTAEGLARLYELPESYVRSEDYGRLRRSFLAERPELRARSAAQVDRALKDAILSYVFGQVKPMVLGVDAKAVVRGGWERLALDTDLAATAAIFDAAEQLLGGEEAEESPASTSPVRVADFSRQIEENEEYRRLFEDYLQRNPEFAISAPEPINDALKKALLDYLPVEARKWARVDWTTMKFGLREKGKEQIFRDADRRLEETGLQEF